MNEGRSTSKARGWGVVIGGVLIVAAVVALYSPSMCLFDLREISIDGMHRVAAETIRALSGIRTGDNLLRLPLRDARARIVAEPWIADAQLRLRLPHALRIRVVEHYALAACRTEDEEEWGIVVDGGVVVDRVERAPESLLRVRGLTVDSIDRKTGSEVRTAIALLERLHALGIAPPGFHELNLADASDVQLLGDEGVVVRLGPLSEAMRGAEELAALRAVITTNDYQMIDLTYEGEAVLVPR